MDRLTAFLNSGKALYIEGYNFAEDHHAFNFFNMLGINYVADGNDEGDIWTLQGDSAAFTEDMFFDYGHVNSPRCRNDVISANAAITLFKSQKEYRYAAAYNHGNYRVIVSTFMFGALIDGENVSTKIELMNRYLSFFEQNTSVQENGRENFIPREFVLSKNYPNPFTTGTTIKFSAHLNNDPVKLIIYNMLGQQIKTLISFSVVSDDFSANWNGTDENNLLVPAGTYFYKLIIGDRSESRKMILVR